MEQGHTTYNTTYYTRLVADERVFLVSFLALLYSCLPQHLLCSSLCTCVYKVFVLETVLFSLTVVSNHIRHIFEIYDFDCILFLQLKGVYHWIRMHTHTHSITYISTSEVLQFILEKNKPSRTPCLRGKCNNGIKLP